MFGVDDAALALILAGGVSTAGSLYTNSANRRFAKNANLANMQVARENNATQIEMANTAHQREVADLRAAGLNPILSAGGSGASTPTLQGASIDPVHMDNSFEGLANSAKGLTRFISQQYRNQLKQQEADLLLTKAQEELHSSNAKLNDQNWQLSFHESQLASVRQMMLEAEAQSEQGSLTADFLRNQMESLATQAETGLGWTRNPDGSWHAYIRDGKQFDKALDVAREGIQSDLKVRANRNWRANLSSFTPFVSPAAVNSAASAARGSSRTRP